MWLRQSTAGQEILLGPFLDDTDGKTAETALTIANTDIKIWKEGAVVEANKTSGGGTHIAGGRYYAVLDATDTNTLGKLEVNVHVTGALPVRREFMVLSANVYDSLVLGTDLLDSNASQLGGTAQTGRDIGASVLLSPGTGTGQISLASGAVTAGTVSDKTGYSISGTKTTLDALNDISTAQVNTEVDTALTDIHLDHLLAVDYDPATKPGVATALLNELIENDAGVSRFTTNALEQAPGGGGGGDATAANQTTIINHLTDIKGATFSTSTDSLEAIRNNHPSNFADLQVAIGSGWVTVGTNNDKLDYEIAGTMTRLDDLNNISTTQVNTEVDTALADIHLDHLLAVDYNPAAKPGVATALLNELVEDDAGVSRFTINALEQGPSGSGASAAAIADAVWDEVMADHLSAGSTGEKLNTASSGGDPWSTSLPGAYGAGTAGNIVGNNLNATVSSRSAQTTVDTVNTNVSTVLADTNEMQGDLTDGGRLDLLIDSLITSLALVKAKTDNLTFTDASKVDASLQIANDIKADVANKIADHIIRRSLASVLASGDGDAKDFRSLAGAISKLVNKVAISGSTLTTYEADDITALGTQTVTTSSSANPVVGVDTD